MAEVYDIFDKFCIHYFNSSYCPYGDQCSYPHKGQFEVEQIHYTPGNEYFVGHIRVHHRICRFFLRGNCVHQENCRYRHEMTNEIPSVQKGIERSSRAPRANAHCMPSTSQSETVTNKNSINNSRDLQNKERIIPCIKDKDNKPQPDGDKVEEGACASPPLTDIYDSWVNAPEFVPKSSKPKSYAEALSSESVAENNANKKLCPYLSKDGLCKNLTVCNYIHGEMCDMCERLILHPYNEEQRKRHRQECLKQHERNMELSFAVARSQEKTCGVCFEVIMEKTNGEQRFGILPNCNHCFCLSCIRKWRQARQFENKIIRACPECRVTSDFVCPSMYWVDTKEDKDKLIEDYKKALAKKDCKYFKKGQGNCPFGNKCFYLHAFPDGRKCDVGPPPRQRRARNADTDMDVLQQVMLWDFLDERDFPWQSLADDLEDLVSFFTDSEDSDFSDFEFFLD
ncbi:probable E3 ubiquitin-protein ligase makorin-1 isoform X1 [Diorhabda sublineata]|uniref:probable E3 ubiquitin-protein ligase makorin-1 isoform X1 n=1 Tax=Diorhabda sublineata TaxID=1163346 RepID=UPI0024E19387|nr:probable E3 ubiquitin-protein ligase makorin-1 isoform X1 [Diorhabda sublineata]